MADNERIKEGVKRFLIEKGGYSENDIEVDTAFDVVIGNEINKSKADLIISLNGKRFMVIKCAPGSLVSREREVLCSARILDFYQIPFAVVTNGVDAEVLDTISGKVIGHGLGAIPSRAEAIEILKVAEFKRLPEEKAEKEKRIFLAFNALKCPSECD